MPSVSTRPSHSVEFGAHSRRDMLPIAELWRHRGLLYFLTWRDIKVRYKQTLLGAGWAVFKPLIMMGIFTVVFGSRAGADAKQGYSLFVLCGLLPWLLFSTAVSTGSNSVVASERLVTKVYFPRIILPLAAIGPSVIDFLISCVLLAIALVWFSPVGFSWTLLLAPLPILLTIIFAAAVGVAAAGMSVKYRDLRHVFPFIVQVWMFGTPSIYLLEATLSWDAWHVVLNPMSTYVASFRAMALGEAIPWDFLAVHGLASVILLLLAGVYFRFVERSFADVI